MATPELDAGRERAHAQERALDELARGGLRGDASGAWALVDRAWGLLSRRIAVFQRALGVDRENWDDCGQEALLRVWVARTSYAGTEPGQLLAWIFRIVEREHLRLIERRGRRGRRERRASELAHHEREEDDDPVARASTGADPTLESAERRDALRALEECMRGLREDRRQVVELLYSADAPTEREVAAMIEVSKSQVNALRKSALAALAQCLGHDEGDA